MSSAAELFEAAIPVPSEWQARSTWDGSHGEIVTGPIKGQPLADFSDVLRKFEYDPALVEVVGKVSQWKKEQRDGTWLTSYFFGVRSKADNLDLPALYAAAKRKPRAQTVATGSDVVTVAIISDIQAGKVGSRGGTPELLERLEVKRAALVKHLALVKPSRTILVEPGDVFEGFESGGNPMFTNDLSLAQQMDVAGTEVYNFAEVMHKHGRVDVMTCTSNHTAWRRGKQQLGRPSDDLGLHVHRNVERVAKAAGLDAHWHYPGEYDESMTLDVNGTVLGLVHGNQYSPGKAAEWWSKQQHGGQPIGAADILITGHYHHFMALPTGRNPYTGRSKWWLQSPTLDNGSDWFRNMAGDDSDPGLLVFNVTADGFDLQSLTVL